MIHQINKKIYYHDTDCGQVIYYANYLKYLEEARTEYMSAATINLKQLSEQGTWFIVSHVDINYRSPGRYADSLNIFTKISRIRHASLEFHQEIKRNNDILVEAKTILVCVNQNFRPQAIPENISKQLQNGLSDN